MPFPVAVVEAKEHLANGLKEAALAHAGGSSGRAVCRQIAEQRDNVIRNLFLAAIRDLGEESLLDDVALVAHGGYGRGEVSLGSDVDLMLVRRSAPKRTAFFAQRVMRDICDTGLSLGHSVRTVDEATQLVIQDPVIGTSLIESRYLAGDNDFFQEYQKAILTRISRQQALFCKDVAKNRAEERARYGETVYLLEPNLKRSSGGLRDIQMIRWIGQARFGVAEFHSLFELGELSMSDVELLDGANEFLLRLRNELHFHAGHCADVLNRAEQVRVAAEFGYQDSSGQLAVERFMQDYFRHTQSVRHVVERFTERALADRRFGRAIETVASHRVGSDYRVGPNWIRATGHGLAKLEGNLVAIMQLIELANLYNKRISPETWEVIRQVNAKPLALPLATGLAPVMETSTNATVNVVANGHVMRRFRMLLKHPARLGELLRGLHETLILQQLIPEFEHARGLIQFNQYHKYTVDEHSLRAVEWIAKFSGDETTTLGRAYRRVERKELLHLALLIHDIGKGYEEDHSIIGERIAREIARRFDMSPEETETLAFLVRNHLMMNHLALRRDVEDRSLIVPFAVEVGTPERLRMLFCMTAADLAAVGPDTWNSWKAEMLTSLFYRTLEHLADDAESTEVIVDNRFEAEVTRHLTTNVAKSHLRKRLDSFDSAYLATTPVPRIAQDIEMLNRVLTHRVVARGDWFGESHTVRFTIGTNEDIASGIFHRLTGAITACGLEILSAEIHTFSDRMVLDRFVVHDPDFADKPPEHRIQEVEERLARSLLSPEEKPPQFRRTWSREAEAVQNVAKTRVSIDNNTSTRYTILDIFAPDRLGMLYTITRKLFELDLEVSRARISTYGDQIVDVFYVTDREGKKIIDHTRLDQLRDTLIETIEARQ